MGIIFYGTSILLKDLKENDPIMQEIKNKKGKYEKPSINAEIIGNNIISGTSVKKEKTL